MHAHIKSFATISFKINKKASARLMYLKLIRRYPFNWIFYADLLCFELYGKHYNHWKNERKKKNLKSNK